MFVVNAEHPWFLVTSLPSLHDNNTDIATHTVLKTILSLQVTRNLKSRKYEILDAYI